MTVFLTITYSQLPSILAIMQMRRRKRVEEKKHTPINGWQVVLRNLIEETKRRYRFRVWIWTCVVRIVSRFSRISDAQEVPMCAFAPEMRQQTKRWNKKVGLGNFLWPQRNRYQITNTQSAIKFFSLSLNKSESKWSMNVALFRYLASTSALYIHTHRHRSDWMCRGCDSSSIRLNVQIIHVFISTQRKLFGFFVVSLYNIHNCCGFLVAFLLVLIPMFRV